METSYRWPKKPLIWFALAAFLYAGIFCCAGLHAMPDQTLLPREGKLNGIAAEDGGSSLLVRDAVFIADEQEYDIGGVQLYAQGTQLVKKGQSVSVFGVLSPVKNRSNPGAFDSRAYLFRKNIRYVMNGSVESLEGEAKYTVFERLRRHLLERIAVLWPEDAPLLSALLLGTGDVEEELYSRYQASGIAHILAVSGLHVGFAAAFLSVLLCFLPRCSAARTCLLLLGLLGYCLLTGASPSTQRASLMAAMLALSRWRGRESDGISALSLAAGVILLLDPRQLLSVGFRMSVSAMMGIVLLYPVLYKPMKVLPGFLRASVALTVSAQLGCLPAMLSAFGSLSVYAPLSNLIAVPLAGLAVPLGFLTLLLDRILPPLAPFCALLCRLCVQGMDLVAEGFSLLPSARWLLPKIPASLGLLWPLLLFCLLELRGKKRLYFGAGVGALCALVLGVFLAGLYPSRLQITFLSVGCADSAILRRGGDTVVVDTGRSGREALAALQAEDPMVETLILTHGDADHCAGAELLLKSLAVKELCYPKGLERDRDFVELLHLAKDSGTALRPVAMGDTLWYDGFVLKVLWPAEARMGRDNDDSLVLLAADERGSSALLTADVGGESLSAMDLPEAELVKLPHHGSRDGLTKAQIHSIGPQLAVLSVGANGYGLPDARSLNAFEGVPLYRTDADGAVRVVLGEEIRVMTFSPLGKGEGAERRPE